MLSDFNDWSQRHPAAARELIELLNGEAPKSEVTGAESAAQQQQRFQIARAGGLAWRNNVGATPSKCESCGAPQRIVRYGLANESKQVNSRFKSSDLIGVMPRVIEPQDVGRTIGQFVSIECKRPGWKYAGNGREAAQAAWLALVHKAGGFAAFSTGEVEL